MFELIASAAGIFLAIIIGAVVAIIVLINLRDLREWKQYMADKAEAEARFTEKQNPLYRSSMMQVTKNPTFEANS